MNVYLPAFTTDEVEANCINNKQQNTYISGSFYCHCMWVTSVCWVKAITTIDFYQQ